MVSEMLFHPVEGCERTEKLTSWQPRGRERQVGQVPARIFKDIPADIHLPLRPFPTTFPWFLEVVPPLETSHWQHEPVRDNGIFKPQHNPLTLPWSWPSHNAKYVYLIHLWVNNSSNSVHESAKFSSDTRDFLFRASDSILLRQPITE